jgi:hypothetical protein
VEGRLLFVFLWTAFAIAVGVLAERYGRSGGWWGLAALVFSPLLAGVMLLAAGKAVPQGHLALASPLQSVPGADDIKICPKCAETIKAAAVLCRFCGYEYPAPGANETAESLSSLYWLALR